MTLKKYLIRKFSQNHFQQATCHNPLLICEQKNGIKTLFQPHTVYYIEMPSQCSTAFSTLPLIFVLPHKYISAFHINNFLSLSPLTFVKKNESFWTWQVIFSKPFYLGMIFLLYDCLVSDLLFLLIFHLGSFYNLWLCDLI